MMRALRPLRRFSTARVADDAASGWSISAAGAAAAKPDPTHHVANQSQPLSDYNAYEDVALREAVHAGGGEWFDESLARLGAQTGSAEWQTRARVANRSIPELRTHDRFGHRVDVVEYHPHYHELMTLALESGPVSSGSIERPSMCLRTFARVEGHCGPNEHGHSKFSSLVSPIGS